MQDNYKTKAQLLEELNELRQKLAQLEARQHRRGANAEEKLMENQQVYKSALNLLRQNVYQKDRNHRITFGNKAYLNTVGLPLEECLGKTNEDFFPPDLAAKYTADDNYVLETGETIEEVERHRVPGSDHDTYVRVVKTPVMDEDGNIVGTQGVFWDVTERIKTENQLTQERNLLQTLIDNVPDLIYVKDTQGNFMLVNQAHAHYMGVATPDALVGKSDFDFYPAELAKQYYADELALIESKQPLLNHEEVNVNHQTGEQSWTSTTKVPFYDAQGNMLGVVGISRDVTARKQAEEEIKKRATDMETVTQVSTAISTILDTDELLQNVVNLTKERFGLYHAHIYLLDNIGDTLNLTAGAGKVGRKMVKQGWSIPFNNEQSLVAKAARSKQGVIVNNVREAPDWLPNPLLPDTFSELAVPLIAGNELLGVLDVQSDEVSNFTDNDLSIQTTLAAQIAVALQNARSFAEQQKTGLLLRDRVKELNCLNDVGREIASTPPIPELLQWVTERIPTAMQHPELCTVAIEYNDQIYGNAKAKELPTQIVNALWVTGEIVGRIYIAYTEKQEFLNEESALLGGIASRVASYIENRNLVEQTQQRAAELEENSNFLNSIIDNIPSGLFVKDAKDLKFVEWNKANESIHGLMKEDLLGKGDRDFFEPEEAEFFVTTDRSVLAGGEMVDIPEEIVHTPHHGVRFLHTRKIPIIGADGQPKFLLGISEDITESKQVQDALARERDLLQTLMDNSPDHIFFRDTDSRFIRTNNSHAQTILGLNSAEEAIGKTDFDLFLKEDAQRFYDEEQEIMRTGQAVYDKEGQVPTIEGTIHWVSEHKIPIKDETGKVTGLLGIARDITDRKEAEVEREELLAQVQRLAAIVENHPDFIGVGSMEGQVLYMNPAGLVMMGLPPDHTITSMGAKDFYPPEQAEQVMQVGLPAALEHGSWSAESVLQKADGTTIPVEQTLAINYDSSGDPSSFSITIRDISERKVADAERERLLAEVEATYRQYVKGEWDQYLKDEHGGRWHIEYGQSDALPVNGNDIAKIETPIALRGQQIGKLNLEDLDPDRKWTSEELALVETVSGQLVQTIENLRLFGDTQQRATREQLTRQIADKMRAAPDVDTIVQTGLGELAKVLGVSRTYLKLNTEFEQDK